MSTARPITEGRPRPDNTVVLVRDAYQRLNDLVVAGLAAAGHPDVRPSHSAAFENLDDDGTTVSTLAERAQMTKQAMAELVRHLERHGYVERVPDPSDGRAKLVRPTRRGRALIATAQRLVPEIEARIAAAVGERDLRRLQVGLRSLRGLSDPDP